MDAKRPLLRFCGLWDIPSSDPEARQDEGHPPFPSGEITAAEMYGPLDYESCKERYLVFRAGCIMLRLISPAQLDNYEIHIRRLAEQHGKSAWALVCPRATRAHRAALQESRRACCGLGKFA